MSKELYQEALADVKKVTEVAEDNAKRAVLEAVVPRIRDLIERELLKEDSTENDDLLLDDPGTDVVDNEVMASLSPPDDEGKVTLDLDAVGTPGDATYELNKESTNLVGKILSATEEGSTKEFELSVYKMVEMINRFANASKIVRESNGFNEQISLMISRVENMYGYVQESIGDNALKQSLENKLEECFQNLNKLQEMKMSNMQLKDLIREDDAMLDSGQPVGDDEAKEGGGGGMLTLKLSGLPDDVDLDNVGVDLVADDEGVSDEEPSVEDGDEDSDLGDLEMSDDAMDSGEESGEEEKMESLELSDDTIVEIDENMLRREIAKMKSLREDAGKKPWAADSGVDASVLDDFGDGDDDGDAFLDGEVTTEAEELDAEVTAVEADSCVEDEKVEQQESLKRKVSFEKKLQERAKFYVRALLKTGKTADKAEARRYMKRFNESVKRLEQLNKRLTENAKKRSNSDSTQPAENTAVQNLRKELSEKNLHNMKLTYAVKLLQNESLTKRQKAQVAERMDEAKTAREVKLVYDSLLKTFDSNSSKNGLTEGKKVLGSSSRVTTTASAQNLNEGFEEERWLQLAGLAKK